MTPSAVLTAGDAIPLTRTRRWSSTLAISIGMAAGVLGGYLLHVFLSAPSSAVVASSLAVVGDIFLRLVKMLIAPLVLSTLVVGIGQLGRNGNLGRIGLKTMIWFLSASTLSMAIGLAAVHLVKPGDGIALREVSSVTLPASQDLTFAGFATHIAPTSIFDALARNEILQIIVFSVLAGLALLSMGERGRPAFAAMETLSAMMLGITGYVMRIAPIAVACSLAATIATEGLSVIATYGRFLMTFYGSMAVLWACLTAAAYLIIGTGARALISGLKGPVMLAFSTASSEAAYPRTLAELERAGVPRQIGGFVLPLGYSFNLDGSMLYCVIGIIFLAQAYGVDLSIGQQASLLLLLTLTSKGMAGVPRASIVVIAALLPHVGIPESALILILGIDQLLDMGRSATNVVGNGVAAAVIAKWEGAYAAPLSQPMDEDAQLA